MQNYNYPPGSHRAKEQAAKATPTESKKKVEKVTAGTVKTKKKSAAPKIADMFLSEDAGNVGQYLLTGLTDVLVPAVKRAVVDIVVDSVNMIFFGEKGGKRPSTGASYVSYNRFSGSESSHNRTEARGYAGYSYADIYLESRADADEVLSAMDDLVDRYGQVTVADLYDLVGKSGTYTDNYYGWTSLRTAEAVRTRDGWRLKLPKALSLK